MKCPNCDVPVKKLTKELVEKALEQVGLTGNSVYWDERQENYLVAFHGGSEQEITYQQLSQLGQLLKTDRINVSHQPEERYSEDTVEPSELRMRIWEGT